MSRLNKPFLVVTGPCVIESEEHTLYCAEHLKTLFENSPFDFIFKASYDKANRSSIESFRGPGLEVGLKILERVKKELEVPIFTDVHSAEEATCAAEVCDVIQIPAFLCRQTDLLVAAGKTGVCINIKKGQFMAPWDMKQAVLKIESTGNKNIMLTDRGTTFGYNNLVSDMRAIPIMEEFGYPVLFDATHSVQLPAGLGSSSSGQREFIPPLSRAAIAAGCHGMYAESHPNPQEAKCDAATVLSFDTLKSLLGEWERIDQAMRELSLNYA